MLHFGFDDVALIGCEGSKPDTRPRSIQRFFLKIISPAPESPVHGPWYVCLCFLVVFGWFCNIIPAQKVRFDDRFSYFVFASKQALFETIGALITLGTALKVGKYLLPILQLTTTPWCPSMYSGSVGPDHRQAGRINEFRLDMKKKNKKRVFA